MSTESPAAESDSRGAGARTSFVWTAAPITAWSIAFVLLRILAVSGYRWDTAFSVSTTLSVSDAIPLVFGSLMGGHVLVEVLLVLLLPLFLADLLWAQRGHRPTVVLILVVAVAILVSLLVSFGNWWLLGASAAVFALFAAVHAMPAGSAVRRTMAGALARTGLISGAGVLIAAIFVQTPWVPHEVISTRHGEVSGYVLNVDSGYLDVLTDDHEFRILISSDVISRR
ncbi:hypothetical protein [Gordonia shandongensis]|uniref:hypothetical protein n=1 Tax=Gordonia shandongensis TaxID=376351 RepID=UPI00047B025D|nr:hypothetical protein [Gordonia shandongensis]